MDSVTQIALGAAGRRIWWGYYEAYLSVLDAPHQVDFVFHTDQTELLEPLRDHWPVQRLAWFTQGFYAARLQGEQLVLSDLRMGSQLTDILRRTFTPVL
jgi:hypothetical protein